LKLQSVLAFIHYNTIYKHLDNVDFSELLAEDQRTFRILTDDVILSIYRAAMKGSAASQKFWLQFVEGWTEKQETKHSREIKVKQKPPVIFKIMRSQK
jgi:hypothetical protein